MDAYLFSMFSGVLTNAVYDVIKNLALSIFKDKSYVSKLLVACNNAAEIFYTKYGDDFGDKNNSFLARDVNWQIIIHHYTFYRSEMLSSENLDANGFNGAKAATEDALVFFINALNEEIHKYRELDEFLFKKEFYKSVEHGIKEIKKQFEKIKFNEDDNITTQDNIADVLIRNSSEYYNNLRGPNGRFYHLNISDVILTGRKIEFIDTNVKIDNEDVPCAVYNSDNTKVLSASYDNTIRQWDTINGKCLAIAKNISGLIFQKCSFVNLNPKSIISPENKKILQQYNVLFDE